MLIVGSLMGRLVRRLVVCHEADVPGPVVCHPTGIVLLHEHCGHGLGSAAQCLFAGYPFSMTLANRIEAGTEAENIAERRGLEKVGLRKEGLHRGRAYRAGRIFDGLTCGRLRSGPHP